MLSNEEKSVKIDKGHLSIRLVKRLKEDQWLLSIIW